MESDRTEDEDIITIHLGKIVSDELYEEIANYIAEKLNEKYYYLIDTNKIYS